MKRRRLFRNLTLAAAVLVIVFFEVAKPALSPDPQRNAMLTVLITRLTGAAAVFLLLPEAPMRGGRTHGKKAILTLTLAALVSLNNAPWIGLLTGEARVTAPFSDGLLLAAESLAIGLFEELAFRGLLFPAVLEKCRGSVFRAVFLSSLLFALVHLVNLAEDAPGAVVMQVGYSFLIGGMCAVILLEWGSVWLCALLHAVYDFGGALVPRLGEGRVWDPITVALTAVLGLAAAAVFVRILLREDEAERSSGGGEGSESA